MNELLHCYNQIKTVMGDKIEPFESVALVEKYRRFWRPEKVKVLLLAESHVFTTDSDRSIPIPNISGLNGYPDQYAKFVYCLGYGEWRLTGDSKHPKRDGTPQFWKIFFSCVNDIQSNDDFAPVLGKTKFGQRLRNKINILQKMKDSGVWLVDSSIVALYDGGEKPNSKLMSSVIRTSWNGYTSKVLKDCNPEHVIVIGKGVAQNVVVDLDKIAGQNYSVIAQPNAHLSASEHLRNYREYYRLCAP